MARNIQRTDFLDIFKSTSVIVDDVTRRNPNVLVSNPTLNTSSQLENRVIVFNTLAPAWQEAALLNQTMAVFGGPVEIRARIKVSAITTNTFFNLSFGVDGAEVAGNRYGLARIDSLNFNPMIEYSHIVTGIPAGTHKFSIFGSVESRSGSGSGFSATITQGIAERIIIKEVK